ncbi:MAG TPA: PQQ-dependent sugar dehydrogenase [Steroidobacteraceae bacterium]|nr:PQQ-dependent sugar dehydrogenase [Steroidobacteraceae bacterium]
MRSSSICLPAIIAGLSFAAFAATANAQSPFPTPNAESLPLDTGREELVRSCNLCHPIMPVLGQQRTEPEWRGVVDAMRGRGAKVTDEEAVKIAAYLAKYFAPGMPVRLNAGRMPGGQTFILGGRPPDGDVVPGRPLETRDPVGKGQKPAFAGQTRAPAIVTKTPVEATLVAHGLDHPWSLAFLPNGHLLITEKPGKMRILTTSGDVGAKIANVPAVAYKSDGGLLDVVIDPHFAKNRRIYFAYAEPREGGQGLTLGGATLSADETALEDVRVLLRIEPSHPSVSHFGCRLLFDAQGKLFMTSGERMDPILRQQAQQLDSRLGKLLRLNTDGTAAPGNPFEKTPGALPDIWTYGHRNSQGLAYHPVTHALWSVEHGQAGGDELNVILPGRNYGWPLVAYGMENDRTPINGGKTQDPHMEQPKYFWDPAIGPTSMAFYTGKLIPEWRGNLFITGHLSQHLVRLVLKGDRVVGEERLLLDQKQMMRWVGQGPDGALWVLTDDADGRLLRLVPRAK